MHLSLTLSIYLGKQFLLGIGLALAILVGLVLVVDLVELLRRAASEDMGLGLVISMAVLKLPVMAQKALPFATLFGGIFTFARLTRTHELVVARAAGVSVWQFLLPAMLIAIGLGIIVVTIVNPLSAAMAGKYDRLEAKYFHKNPSLLAVSPGGLWLRQADGEGQSVIHAESVSDRGFDLKNVIIFLYDIGGEEFLGRIDAESARLATPFWVLSNALLSLPGKPGELFDTYKLPTTLTLEQIQDSFASPETMSFWTLPGFIRTLQEAGFTAVKHRVHWHSVLSLPLFLSAMVLIAATFALRLNVGGSTSILVLGGVLTGFCLFVLSDIVLALGLSGKIPASLAAWAPAGASTMFGISLLFHLEDG